MVQQHEKYLQIIFLRSVKIHVVSAHSVPVFIGCMKSDHAADDWLILKSTDS